MNSNKNAVPLNDHNNMAASECNDANAATEAVYSGNQISLKSEASSGKWTPKNDLVVLLFSFAGFVIGFAYGFLMFLLAVNTPVGM